VIIKKTNVIEERPCVNPKDPIHLEEPFVFLEIEERFLHTKLIKDNTSSSTNLRLPYPPMNI